jgi:2-polyprenyl-3-methyl-5-hydroxy-6-metoxy-1,4-benzoquinol methylase
MTQMNNDYFNIRAKTWDDNPMRQQLALSIFGYIQQNIPLNKNMVVLDYGCGTGLLSFLLSEKVKSVHAVDTSFGMLEQVKSKIEKAKISTISTELFDAENDNAPDVRYDLIVSAMTLHHLKNAPKTITKLISLIKPGSWIALADLCKEDGSFHTDIKVNYFGFEPSELESLFKSSGIEHITTKPVFEIPKNQKIYPVFCIAGQKPVISIS